MASQVPGARSHYLPLRGRASLPGALRPPTNHEERWGDHSFALDSVMLSGGARGVFRASITWRTGCFPLVSPCVAPALGFFPMSPEGRVLNPIRRWLGTRCTVAALTRAREHPPPPLRARIPVPLVGNSFGTGMPHPRKSRLCVGSATYFPSLVW